MATLTCDICDGKLVIGSGGVAICGVCGMEHSKERLQEKLHIQPVQISQISHSNATESKAKTLLTLLELSKTAREAGNSAESEAYAIRMLEIDDKSSIAWFLKGSAAGWQSTMRNIRLQETLQCYIKAVESSPHEQQPDLISGIEAEFHSICVATVQLAANHFKSFPNSSNEVQNVVNHVIEVRRILSDVLDIELNDLTLKFASVIETICRDAWNNVIFEAYMGRTQYPSKHQYDDFKEYAMDCRNLIEYAINLKPLHTEDIARFEFKILISQNVINARSYREWYNSHSTWHEVEYKLSPESIGHLYREIDEYRTAIERIQKADVAKRQAAEDLRKSETKNFWINNISTKNSLDAEVSRLEQLYFRASADRTTAEKEFILKRKFVINKVFERDYSANDELPHDMKALIDSIPAWDVEHQNVRTKSLADTKLRLQEREVLTAQVAEQDAIIAQNKGFFGEPARIRKAAQQEKQLLQGKLSAYSDLG